MVITSEVHNGSYSQSNGLLSNLYEWHILLLIAEIFWREAPRHGTKYFLHFKKVGTLDWTHPFPADASLTSRANKGPASSALPWPMAYQPWVLAEMTQRRPFVDTGRLVIIRRKLPRLLSQRRLC